MTDYEVLALVEHDRYVRSTERAIGRVTRSMKGAPVKKPRALRLEEIVAPEIAAKLRATGATDEQILTKLKEKGVI